MTTPREDATRTAEECVLVKVRALARVYLDHGMGSMAAADAAGELFASILDHADLLLPDAAKRRR